jgi:intein/homing endonuclease
MNIEDIQVGDFVYSYNTLTGELELKEVTAVFSLVSDHINYITIVDEHGNEQVIETTDGHPFWVVTDEPDLERAAQGMIDENGAILYHNNIAPTEHGFWVEAKDLREGDVFQ